MNTKVWVEGSEYILNEKNWVTAGGEADIYRIKNKAFKIFKNSTDRSLEERVLFADKWKKLNIARPEQIIKSKSGLPIGLVMPWLSGNPILMAFNNNWRTSNNVDLQTNAKWTEQLRYMISEVLNTGARMVDANEWNYLICKNDIWAIDSDSWCLPGIHATAQMPSIKDWHSPSESAESDWFAAAIVSFQLWSGIHPYKGTYAAIKKGDLQERMKQKISVLHKDVKVPSTTRNWNDIPKGLLNWYLDVFEHGDRQPMPPMSSWQNARAYVINNLIKASASGSLKTIFIRDCILRGNILSSNSVYTNMRGDAIAWLKDVKFNFVCESSPDVFTAFNLHNDNLELITEFSSQIIPNVNSVWCSDNLIWVLSNTNMLEVYNRTDINTHSYFKQISKWSRTVVDTFRNGNVPYAYELGGLCMWYEQDGYPVISRIKLFDGHKIIKALQIKDFILIASKKTKKDNTMLYMYNVHTQSIVFSKEIPEDNFIATSVGEKGILIIVNDGDVLLWNGSSMTSSDGDVLLSDDVITYEGKPYVFRNSKLFRVSNK